MSKSLKKGTDTSVEINNVIVVRKVLRAGHEMSKLICKAHEVLCNTYCALVVNFVQFEISLSIHLSCALAIA